MKWPPGDGCMWNASQGHSGPYGRSWQGHSHRALAKAQTATKHFSQRPKRTRSGTIQNGELEVDPSPWQAGRQAGRQAAWLCKCEGRGFLEHTIDPGGGILQTGRYSLWLPEPVLTLCSVRDGQRETAGKVVHLCCTCCGHYRRKALSLYHRWKRRA